MPPADTARTFDSFRHWARNQFDTYRTCVGFIESQDAVGDISVGTCFHVGEGVFITARHVLAGRREVKVAFDDQAVAMRRFRDVARRGSHWAGEIRIVEGPYFHADPDVDVACFRLDFVPDAWIPLGGHLDAFLGQYDLLLHRTLVMGHPRVPHSDRTVLVASIGEINALVTLYDRKYVHFLVSSVARGGFSGGPVLVAYNELNEKSGTALLGLVTDSLVHDGKDAESGFMAVLSLDPIYQCLEDSGMLPPGQVLVISE